MDTRGYVYPPMDDLLKRQNAAGQGGFDPNSSDGGDLNGGDGLHPKPGESDVGSGLELDRSLQRVAAQEAWLNEQSQQPVESWLQSHGGKQISLENFGGSDVSTDFTKSDADRSLVVVDSRSNQWEELSRDLSDNTDLLVLDDNRGGIDQLKDYFASHGSESRYSNISLIASAQGDVLSFGSEQFVASDLADAIASYQQSDFLGLGSSLQLFASEYQDVSTVSANGLRPAPTSLISSLRQQIVDFSKSDLLDSTLSQAFGADKFESVRNRVDDFIAGKNAPSIELADFGDFSVFGAYLVGENRIILSDSIKSGSRQNRILLEEFGHWLDDDSLEDSRGDEGDIFSRSILGLPTESIRSDVDDLFHYVRIGSDLFQAEFNAQVSSAVVDAAGKQISIDLNADIKAGLTLNASNYVVLIDGDSIRHQQLHVMGLISQRSSNNEL